MSFSYLADSFWLGDLSSVPVGHQGMKNKQQPLQLLCCLFYFFSFCLHHGQDLRHTQLEKGKHTTIGHKRPSFLFLISLHKSSSPVRTPTKLRSVLCEYGLLQPGPCDPEHPSRCPMAGRDPTWLKVRASGKLQGEPGRKGNEKSGLLYRLNQHSIH